MAGGVPHHDGDTTYLCVVDGDGMGVSLIQSNASGFGSWLAEPNTGINLHNRGLGFSLEAGHPAEIAPGKRPPHTLSPALATRGNDLVSVFGTMGGDAQPQILLQIAARLFHHGQSPDRAIRSGRWALSGPTTGFDTWTAPDGPIVDVEAHAPAAWVADLTRRGHSVREVRAYDNSFGHAHAIVVEGARRARRLRRPSCGGQQLRRPVTSDIRRQLTSGMTSSMKRAICSSAFL